MSTFREVVQVALNRMAILSDRSEDRVAAENALAILEAPLDEGTVVVYITFGVQYGPSPHRETHPTHPWIDADGYVAIEAPSYEAGRKIAFALFGTAWAFDNTTPPEPRHAPLGELGRFSLMRS